MTPAGNGMRSAPISIPFWARLLLGVLLWALAAAGLAYADVPGGRLPPRGTVPNPGTQQQELSNITLPAPYNVFEFVVTCGACHGGTVDQHAAHFGNWAGTNMASAARDPVFRANQIIVNSQVKSLTGKDGAGNMCFRCHSPNGWYSGRFDPTLAGAADGSLMENSLLLSTDTEGVMCEACHRAMGNVTMKRPDLNPMDPVWNMLSSIDDWPHAGQPYPEGPAAGLPYGDTTLQFNDGMTYNGRYSGSVDVFFSDVPIAGTNYTGQTYGVYPPGWVDQLGNPVGGQAVVNPDGSVPVHFEAPIGPPLNPDGTYNYMAQAISLEHPTYKSKNDFLQSSEFCGSCHELTVPVLNHGMPEQRTYTEWKYSQYAQVNPATGQPNATCQTCHMPRLKHEYSDAAPVTLNPDPALTGWFPYAKARENTAFHKLAGSNRDLPMMMKVLYPEVDLEVTGVPTGNDVRVFPGMLSNRDPMWERTKRNTEISLQDGVSVQITSPPTLDPMTGKYQVKVKVINNTGHRLPSGYPDGRRFWISLSVKDTAGTTVYESGVYDPATATLYTDSTKAGLTRALSPQIDSANNAVMIYQRVTGICDAAGTTCTAGPSLLNNKILFDNRIPPLGFTYADYQAAGVKFWKYDPVTLVPVEDVGRYPDGQNWDEVTYTFIAPAGATLMARAEIYWQTHTRELMDHLRVNDTSMLQPQGPPSPMTANYPLTPTYLSASILQTTGTDFAVMTALDGSPLSDNWGGVAYAAWLLTGKGAPFLVAADDTTLAGAPPAPANVMTSNVTNPATGLIDPFTLRVSWDPVAQADGYLVWIRYGASDLTASWDRLALVQAPTTEIVDTTLNVGKTYAFKVQAYNGKGFSPDSLAAVQQTPVDLPLPPMNLAVLGVTDTTVTLSWYDQADNETGFVIQRQDVPLAAGQPLPPFVEVARIPTQTPGLTGFGGNTWTDTGLMPGRTYNYQVAAYNASGMSTFTLPVAATTTTTAPVAATNLSAVGTVVGNSVAVNLTWADNSTNELGFKIQRATDTGFTRNLTVTTVPANTTTFVDGSVLENTVYYYRVIAYNNVGDAAPSNTASVKTPIAPPVAPTNLGVGRVTRNSVDLTWQDNSWNETGFEIWMATSPTGPFRLAGTTKANATAYTVRKLTSGVAYWFQIRAMNAGGPSGWAGPVQAQTQ